MVLSRVFLFLAVISSMFLLGCYYLEKHKYFPLETIEPYRMASLFSVLICIGIYFILDVREDKD